MYEKSAYCGEPRAKEVELLVPVPFWSRAAISSASVPIYIAIQEYGTERYLFHLSYILILKMNAFE